MFTQSKSRWNNKRDDPCNKSDYILIKLVWYYRVFMGDGTIEFVAPCLKRGKNTIQYSGYIKLPFLLYWTWPKQKYSLDLESHWFKFFARKRRERFYINLFSPARIWTWIAKSWDIWHMPMCNHVPSSNQKVSPIENWDFHLVLKGYNE